MARGRSQEGRFTILDGMALVAALGVGLAWCGRLSVPMFQAIPNPGRTFLVPSEWTFLIVTLILPCLVVLSLVLPALGLRGPTRSRRRSIRGPGISACLAASIATPVAMATLLGSLWLAEARSSSPTSSFSDPLALSELLRAITPAIGLVVIASWALLALQGRWRAQPTWVDRAGRALGVLWVIAGSAIIWFWTIGLA